MCVCVFPVVVGPTTANCFESAICRMTSSFGVDETPDIELKY